MSDRPIVKRTGASRPLDADVILNIINAGGGARSSRGSRSELAVWRIARCARAGSGEEKAVGGACE